MKIYISGKITGLAPAHYTKLFRDAELSLMHGARMKLGYTKAVNPVKIKPLFGIKSWFFYMITDIYELLKCDAIFMLSNWKNSRGAKIEHWIAKKTRKTIIYQNKKNENRN
jgi:hypothetical protein